ncbi:acyl-CoA thioesterase [Telmatospirillum sp.]|uniref:acyl-CoA thioesterase n=1 Tax=Telmatospirillum sp. TaxID=2079197 RepID=UPI00284D5D45|nr:acyl-CoA thioesterase [Telmatospirillum sp.]MDR3440195.1 acyl-CoA thioesterase [Telmatospirillum sp.]
MSGFSWRRKVSFVDCDPAKIAYTGRLVGIAIEAIEVFWESVLDGQSWYALQEEHGLGMPFVRLESSFQSPVTPMAPLDCVVTPVRLGTSSVALRVSARQQDRHCYELHSVSSFVSIRDLKAIAIPDWIRAALVRHYPALNA